MTKGHARKQVWTQLEARARALIGEQATEQVLAEIRVAVAGGLDGPVWQQVGSAVGEKMPGESVVPWWEGDLGPQLGDSLAFYDAVDRLGIDLGGLFDDVVRVVRNAGWWWPMDGGLILTERPTVLSRDDAGRLHNATGPAVAYRDGFTVWAWHGTLVPQYAITTDWDVTGILWEYNVEVRRCVSCCASTVVPTATVLAGASGSSFPGIMTTRSRRQPRSTTSPSRPTGNWKSDGEH
ncbi:DUF6745 domain-containing protein [Nocardia sp. NPDC058658]|uniref:DUF6745 domain-containing protein n=1 Tax=Nocardia sp. NPDC058658 TaxID=3346580 RepID=UPI003661E499